MTTPPPGVLPGQRLTANRLNGHLLIGRLVFAAYRDATQAITTSTVGEVSNALQWDHVDVDVLGGWDPAQPTRYRPTIAGWYKCVGGASFNTSTAGVVRGASWRFNGTLPPASTSRAHVSSAIGNTYLTAAAPDIPILFDGVADYVQLCPFQNAVASLDTATGSTRPYASVYYAGPPS